jgi:hypothetical protein
VLLIFKNFKLNLIMKILFYFFVFLMLCLTCLGLDRGLSRMFIASGSDCLMDLVATNVYLSISFFLLFLVFLFFKKQITNKFIFNILIITTFFLWFWSGFMVAIFPEGKVISGWYYFEFNRIELCENDPDYEKILYYETTYEKEYIWTYKIKNKKIETRILRSPFIKMELESSLSEHFSKKGH